MNQLQRNTVYGNEIQQSAKQTVNGMNLNLVQVNAVVAANQFNPSVFNQLWLVENQIVRPDEFALGSGSVFSDMMVNVVSEKFTMLVTPEQLQFAPASLPIADEGIVEQRLGLIVQALPHTPFTGCGLNFTWLVEDDDVVKTGRRLFFNPDSRLHKAFDVEDSRFGGYMSKAVFGGRLKLDVKPLTLQIQGGEATERIQFSFNFHVDAPKSKEGKDVILGHLANWNPALRMSSEIMNELKSEITK